MIFSEKSQWMLLLASILIATVLIASFKPVIADANGNLTTKFRMDRQNYVTCEPIILKYWFGNEGVIPAAYTGDDVFPFVLLNGTGQLEKMTGVYLKDSSPLTIDGRTETGTNTINLLDFYGKGQDFLHHYLPPGKYKLAGKTTASDTVSFVINDPTDKDESLLMKQITNICDSAASKIGNGEQSYKLVSRILNDHPNSVYLQGCICWFLASWDCKGECTKERRQYFARYMIKRFPDSPLVWEAVFSLDTKGVRADEKSSLIAALEIVRKNLPIGINDDLHDKLNELENELKQ